ncbi:hypothetical protein D9613_001974 [Agrocybe pediades]|uniref:Uncharacterized protein n=1 Tax=Agrocybe pediades TaxID=84607 RepID=A0A8H4R3Y0_9AGAR|nr:hypothetical protein D9613_001974 [Agrocybe pediades]
MSSISPPSAPHGSQLAWLDDAAAPVGYLSRKALPIKKNDAEPLNREDVQYDLLDYIFTDKHAVFTNPHPPVAGSKVTFADLYVSALYASSKCSKVLKEKMVEIPAFSIEFAKIALLTNVGRINTTMAFFPEMKTALRTYHPVPSLQKTEGNAQDAPRIKNCLKAAVVPSETQTSSPSTPEEVLAKLRAGQRPSTSVVNLVFVLANHAAPLAELHFDGHLNFLDLFLPNTRLASADRGRVFLWLLYHYLEDEHVPNPFDDAHSIKHANAVPRMRRLSTPELLQENVDTQEEIEFGIEMSQERNTFLQTLISSSEGERKFKINATTPHFVSEGTHRQLPPGLNDGRAFLFYVPRPQDQMNANPPPPEPVLQPSSPPPAGAPQLLAPALQATPRPALRPPPPAPLQPATRPVLRPRTSPPPAREPAPRPTIRPPRPPSQFHPAPQVIALRPRTPPTPPSFYLAPRLALRPRTPPPPPPAIFYPAPRLALRPRTPPPPPPRPPLLPLRPRPPSYQGPQRQPDRHSYPTSTSVHRPEMPVHRPTSSFAPQPRTMFQQAWHLATSTDPLLDSDEEIMDEHARVDYSRRLSIIARLRKKPPPTK